MKILAINGSPKGKNSVTYLMIEEFLKGMRESGWEDQHILLSEMKIHHCMGCFSCWWNKKGVCIFDDDMKKILALECDILLLASPLYVDNISGLLKNFLDRSIAPVNPCMGKDQNGESIHLHTGTQPKLLVMSNCGFPEQTHFEALKVLFRRMARNMQTELIGEIYRGQGPLLDRNVPALKGIVDAYKELLQVAGREIAQNYSLSEETMSNLERPLIPYDQYVAAHNEIFRK